MKEQEFAVGAKFVAKIMVLPAYKTGVVYEKTSKPG